AEVIFERLASHGNVSPDALQALEIEFGVNTRDSLWTQYLQYLNNLLHGNLGVSILYYPHSVADVISQNIRWTLVLLSVSVVISFTLGTLIGIYMAWKRGSALDSGLSSLMTLFYAIPFPWLALLAVYFLGYKFGWFPFSDGYDPSLTPGWDINFLLSA